MSAYESGCVSASVSVYFMYVCMYVYILSHSSNAAIKKPEFYTTNCRGAVYVGKIAQLVLKNLYHTDNTL